MLAENSHLKESVINPTKQLEYVTDHSIQNDSRLMQYNKQIFEKRTQSTNINCAVQTEQPKVNKCNNARCADFEILIKNLKTTIEVLEANIECLRNELQELKERPIRNEEEKNWTVIKSKYTSVQKNSLSYQSQTKRLSEPSQANTESSSPISDQENSNFSKNYTR